MSSFEAPMAGWLSPSAPDKPRDQPASMNVAAQSSLSDEVAATDEVAANDAVAVLVQQYARQLYRVAFSVLRNAAESEDAVQETFLRVWKNRTKLPSVRDTRVWLVRITWNVVLDKKRRTKVRPETDDIAELVRTLPCPARGGEAVAIASQQCRHILSLIDTLPRKEREALLLSAVEELSTGEIAAVLATSESSVRSRLFRARLLLARLLDNSNGQPPERGPQCTT